MFARWIPEVLHELMALSALPRPPDRQAICRARTCVVNEPMERRRPEVKTFDDIDGEVGIELLYEGETNNFIIIWPGGRFFDATI